MREDVVEEDGRGVKNKIRLNRYRTNLEQVLKSKKPSVIDERDLI